MTPYPEAGPGPTRAYLDHNATAPLHPAAREAMLAALEVTGNPSSVHHFGRAARRLLEAARATVADVLAVAPEAVVFTSGATEANALALTGLGRGRIVASAIEHDSVLAWGNSAPIPVDLAGQVQVDAVVAATGDRPADAVVAMMAANNETGVIQPVAQVSGELRAAGGLIHCDAVQAAGRLPLAPLAQAADTMSLSAHKIGGPQGVGALVLGAAAIDRLRPQLRGGAQESRRRPGTENVAGAAGFAAALAAAEAGRAAFIELAERLRAMLEAALSDAGGIVLGGDAPRLANTCCIAMPGVAGETQVAALDLAGVAVSAGSACSSGKVRRSHVLAAMGVPDDLASSAIRISLGPATTETEIARCIAAWRALAGRRRAA